MSERSLPAQGRKGFPARKNNYSAEEKRRLILESAERLFAAKGFHQTTIADISKDCGVHEASIFQYYKTKENLLVTIPERHLTATLEGLTEHLQGIKGAEAKLRKLMWHQLRELTVRKDYTHVLLCELRTLPAFYQSPAYDMIRHYSALAADTIKEGIAEGEVDPDVDPALVLQMVFGAIDSVVLRWLFFDQEYDPEAMADELCAFIKAAIWRNPSNGNGSEDEERSRGQIKSGMILEAAAEVFGDKGYGGATIAEIASRAGIAEASIYQYFRSKEHLLLSVPGNWFNELADELERSFAGRLNPRERLLSLLRRWQIDFQTREWDTRVLILELYRNRAFYSSKAYKNTQRFWNVVRSIVEEGRNEGVFRENFLTNSYLHLIQGTFEHEALARMMLHRKTTTVAKTEKMIKLLIKAITP